jgi:replicative DNA helicase
LIHHFTKTSGKKAENAPGLDDLAWAGIGEYARQWLLVRREEEFTPRIGPHKLIMTAGGSAGHAGIWHVRVEEGIANTDLAGRKWKVQVSDRRPDGGSRMSGTSRSGRKHQGFIGIGPPRMD